jgi:pyruvate/2-oxoglutarate/acetoin dehydrogenase E1 component
MTAESRPDSMRKHMTRAFDEVLGADPAVVYVGEDVEHGG